MGRIVGISAAADMLDVSISRLRGWQADARTYTLAKLRPLFRAAEAARPFFMRVSSHDHKDDLERQKRLLELYCAPARLSIKRAALCPLPGRDTSDAPMCYAVRRIK